jgi:hypothetical protein
VLVVSHQAVLRCILGYFLNKKPGKHHRYSASIKQNCWIIINCVLNTEHCLLFRGTTLYQCSSAHTHQDNNRWLQLSHGMYQIECGVCRHIQEAAEGTCQKWNYKEYNYKSVLSTVRIL